MKKLLVSLIICLGFLSGTTPASAYPGYLYQISVMVYPWDGLAAGYHSWPVPDYNVGGIPYGQYPTTTSSTMCGKIGTFVMSNGGGKVTWAIQLDSFQPDCVTPKTTYTNMLIIVRRYGYNGTTQEICSQTFSGYGWRAWFQTYCYPG